jgi:outer membrane lipoprotein SlyB
LGWLLGVGILVISNIGPFLTAGPIMAALAGACIGALVAGVAGALIGMEMPRFEAVQYQAKMDGGNILISVLTKDAIDRRRAKEIFANSASVTAAEAVVDHAYGRPSGAVGAAMSPVSVNSRPPELARPSVR